MSVGFLVLAVFLIMGGCAVAVMVAVALTTRAAPLPQASVQFRGYVLRRWWFRVLGSAVVVAFVISIPWFPYPHAKQLQAQRHYRVVAEQFGFQLPEAVPLNTPIIFDVTSQDVNHGFGIYDPTGVLVSQVQAMPDYVNHLSVEFTTPGRYLVRCLEYCGIAHANMQASFEVK